jgi:hypothetical protein
VKKAIGSEWNKNEQVHKYADLVRQKMDSFEKKKLIGHKNASKWDESEYKKDEFF